MNIKYDRFAVLVFITLLWISNGVLAQTNTFEEVMTYKDINGYMVIRANVGGTEGDFLLDPRGSVALTESAAAQRKVIIEPANAIYPRAGYQVLGRGVAYGFFIGKNIYRKDIAVVVLKDQPLLKKLGLDGVINFSVFTNSVLTINSKIKTITVSGPYRPAYMKLMNRGNAEFATGGVTIYADLNGKLTKVLVDFYEEHPLLMSKQLAKEMAFNLETGSKADKLVSVPKIKLANEVSLQPDAYLSEESSFSVIGKELLNKGVISFDLDRNRFYFQAFGQGEENAAPVVKKEVMAFVPGKVNPIDRAYFLDHVYDYKSNKEWKVKGDKPVVIDFWATWCGPCIKLMPVMDELAAKYKDKVNFYKVNVDKEGELRQVFEANAIPLLIFGSLNSGSTRDVGADSKEKIEARIEALLK